MAPSRGIAAFGLLRRSFSTARRQSSALTSLATNPAHTTQIYLSRTRDPFLNLSIEHYLLQKTPPESTVLFLYTNRKCIVLGRNQNPWVEVNLALAHGRRDPSTTVELVRRRSGGGTVFHDEGNMNYSIICPTADFDRDKHAEMVVRALRRLGVHHAQVNGRHDIVLDPWTGQDAVESPAAVASTQSTRDTRPRKVSGSAYKLTRLRSLHHGTCLLSSPNLAVISSYLTSPSKAFIKARGVDSVSSPVANVNVAHASFERAVVHEFEQMYGADASMPLYVGEEAAAIPEVAKGMAELTSLDWIYEQTPQFTFASHATAEDDRARPPLPGYLPRDFHLEFTARNAVVNDAQIKVGGAALHQLQETLIGRKVYEVENWRDLVTSTSAPQELGAWLEEVLNGRR